MKGVIPVPILYMRKLRFYDLPKALWFVYGKSS